MHWRVSCQYVNGQVLGNKAERLRVREGLDCTTCHANKNRIDLLGPLKPRISPNFVHHFSTLDELSDLQAGTGP